MARYTKNSKVAVASGRAVDMNLSENHITTMDFGQLLPVYARECIPNDTFNVKLGVKAFMSPLISPTFSNVSLKYRYIFVPFHTVWTKWYDFLSLNTFSDNNGLPFTIEFVPRFYIDPVIFALLQMGEDISASPLPTSGDSDVCIYSDDSGDFDSPVFDLVLDMSDSNLRNKANAWAQTFGSSFANHFASSDIIRIVLGKKGRYILSVLSSLGYELNLNELRAAISTEENYSGLPLLCYAKALVDWYLPSQYQSASPLTSVINRLNSAIGNYRLSVQDFIGIFNSAFLAYENDYFTSAWENPAAPLNTQLNRLPDVGDNDELSGFFDVDYTIQGASDSANAATSWFGVTLLNQVRNYFARNFVSGSRAIERMLSRFGIRLPDDVAQISRYIGGGSTPLDISLINDTSSSGLGNYVGRANLSGNHGFSYEVGNQHGMLFVFASLYNDASFVGGIDRHVLHQRPLDFYTPEFDGKIMQAIAKKEIYNRCYRSSDSSVNSLLQGTFGYIPRYAEYKRSLDKLTGNFMLARYASTLKQYEMNRHMFEQYQETSGAHEGEPAYQKILSATIPDVLFQRDASQFDKIFQYDSDLADNFILVFNFDVHAKRHMISADDTFEIQGKGDVKEFNTSGARIN